MLAFVLLATATQIPAAGASADSGVFLTGKALDATGAPAGGADVYVFDVTEESEHNDSVAHAKANPDGRFELSMPLNAGKTAASGNDGWSNYMALVSRAGKFDVQFFSRRRETGGQWIAPSHTSAARDVVTLKADQRPFTPPAGSRAAELLASARASQAAGAAGPAEKVSMKSVVLARYSNVPTTVARIEVARNTKVKFTYGRRADTEVEVGVEFEEGRWKMGGSKHIGNDVGYEVPYTLDPGLNKPAARYMEAGMDYEDRLEWIGTTFPVAYTKRVATRWTGTLYGYSTWVNGCESQSCMSHVACYFKHNSGLKKTRGENRKYTAAANVAGLMLGATSGWSSNVSMEYDFAVHGNPELIGYCMGGNNTWPPYAQEVYMFTTTTPWNGQ
ncbi:hypothetical protein [Nonomuraea rhodomycinica]|uniref:Uncharacterized protein n=1 Tax=Nonomuraea rhodomycinica TaxID=1712872 RepID=A0A7Y6IYZ0_9ACTN|nr:hypothetical protein [Nonomuraea rhodomycinica]NUW46611.1 hypothetical protein [Nonomuraea rhodomycinica]